MRQQVGPVKTGCKVLKEPFQLGKCCVLFIKIVSENLGDVAALTRSSLIC